MLDDDKITERVVAKAKTLPRTDYVSKFLDHVRYVDYTKAMDLAARETKPKDEGRVALEEFHRGYWVGRADRHMGATDSEEE